MLSGIFQNIVLENALHKKKTSKKISKWKQSIFSHEFLGLELLGRKCQICLQDKGAMLSIFSEHRFGESLAQKEDNRMSGIMRAFLVTNFWSGALGRKLADLPSKEGEMLSGFSSSSGECLAQKKR